LEEAEGNIYLISALSIGVGVTIIALYLTLAFVPCCCKSKVGTDNDNILKGLQDKTAISEIKQKKRRMNDWSDDENKE
jgi:hypothetical protein